MKNIITLLLVAITVSVSAQTDAKLYDIIDAVSEDRLRKVSQELGGQITREQRVRLSAETWANMRWQKETLKAGLAKLY